MGVKPPAPLEHLHFIKPKFYHANANYPTVAQNTLCRCMEYACSPFLKEQEFLWQGTCHERQIEHPYATLKAPQCQRTCFEGLPILKTLTTGLLLDASAVRMLLKKGVLAD